MCNTPFLSVSYTIHPSLPDTYTPTPPCIDQGFSSLFQSQAAVVLSCDSYSISHNKGLSHKWKLLQSHLPLLTVSVSPRLPLPIILAAIFSSNICIVHPYHWTSCGKSASHSPRLCFSMHIITWVIFLLFIQSLIQLLGAKENAAGPLAVNYRIVFRIC